jgi:uncharacterized membrane protein
MTLGKAIEFLGLIPALLPAVQKVLPITIIPQELQLPDALKALGTAISVILSLLAFSVVFVLAHRQNARKHFVAGLLAAVAGFVVLIAFWLYAKSDPAHSNYMEAILVLLWCSAFVLFTSGLTLMLTSVETPKPTPSVQS